MAYTFDYNFKDFLQAVQNDDLFEVVKKAEEACYWAEAQSYRVKGAVKRRQMGSIKFAEQLKGLLFFLKNGIEPMGLSNHDFLAIRPLAEKLVAKGQLKPEILHLFETRDS